MLENLVYKNTDSVIPIKASSFNFMNSKQPVKVKATVTTEGGLVNYDLYEFYLNDPPVAGTFTTKVVWSEDGEDDYESIKSYWAIELTDFYDDSDDEEQYLDLYVYMMIGTEMHLLTSAFKQNLFYIQAPLFSDDPEVLAPEIRICIGAFDSYQALTESCGNTLTVENKPEYLNNYGEVAEILLGMTFTETNLTDVVFASNLLNFAMKEPPRNPIYPSICTMDFHCNEKGICNS